MDEFQEAEAIQKTFPAEKMLKKINSERREFLLNLSMRIS